MGCFLGCFGSSKDRKRRKQRHKVQPRNQANAGRNPVQSTVSVVQAHSENPIGPVLEIRDKPDEQPSSTARKKVTFNSDVKAYEHVSHEEEVRDLSKDKEDDCKREEKREPLAKPAQSELSSEDSSITSGSGSYPPNHRYQNCRDSDEELDYGESDIEEDDDDDEDCDDDNDDGELDYDDIYEDDGIAESRSSTSAAKVVAEGIDRSVLTGDRELKPSRNARDRSAYVHPVLNPVENLTQWKAVKAKGKPSLRQQKENLALGQEQPISFSSDPSFKQLSLSFKEKFNQSEKSRQEVAVDASLSNWLGSSDNGHINKPSTIGLDVTTPEKTVSLGSNSPRSFDDRPILGALTMEELKQLSVESSPRRSPSRSPDDMPIIGTVGTYWNHSNSNQGPGSVSSYKGIPNTTSKYREDRKVNWHSTPFETRLERALNGGGAARAYSTHTSNVC